MLRLKKRTLTCPAKPDTNLVLRQTWLDGIDLVDGVDLVSSILVDREMQCPVEGEMDRGQYSLKR